VTIVPTTVPAKTVIGVTFSPQIKLLILFLGLCVGLSFFTQPDFKVFYSAASKLLAGDRAHFYEPGELTPYKYHPLTLFLFSPFALVPLGIAKLFWSIVWSGSLLVSGYLLHKSYSLSRREWAWVVFLVFHAFTCQINLANITPVLGLLIIVSEVYRDSRWEPIALTLAILLKPYFLLLLAVPIIQRRYGVVLKVGLGLLLGTGLSFIFLFPDGFQIYKDWLATLSAPLHSHNYPKLDNQSLFALVYRINHGEQWPFWPFFLAGTLFASVLWLREALKNRNASYYSILPLSLWIGPLSWIHAQLLLLSTAAEQIQERRNRASVIFAAFCLSGVGQFPWGLDKSRFLLSWGIPLLGYLALIHPFHRRSPSRELGSPREKVRQTIRLVNRSSEG